MRIFQIVLDVFACVYFFYTAFIHENTGFLVAGIWAIVAGLAHLELYGNED